MAVKKYKGYLFSKPVLDQAFQTLLKKGMIVPASQHHKAKRKDRRKYFRVDLAFPLSSQMTLTSINGKRVELGKTEVLIENIGPGGMRFLSIIDLPVRPDITYQFETKIINHDINLIGHIVWKQEVKGIYRYGLKYLIQEKERDKLIKVLNNLSVQMRKSPLVPDCKFIMEDGIFYLKKLLSYNKSVG